MDENGLPKRVMEVEEEGDDVVEKYGKDRDS